MENKYVLFFDGCSKGNPGKAGCGAVMYENNVEVFSKAVFVGKKETNNYAEYMGLIVGLENAIIQNIKVLTVKGDSMLVIKQMNGLYKVKSPNLIPLFEFAKQLETKFDKITYHHVYRNDNKRADELSNIALLL
jgi:ribonuclease HI